MDVNKIRFNISGRYCAARSWKEGDTEFVSAVSMIITVECIEKQHDEELQ